MRKGLNIEDGVKLNILRYKHAKMIKITFSEEGIFSPNMLDEKQAHKPNIV